MVVLLKVTNEQYAGGMGRGVDSSLQAVTVTEAGG